VRNNRTVLDEAARSIRRTFIGSVAGTITMFAVVGAAGAYGLPERLSAQSLSGALASLHAKLSPMIERNAPAERAKAPVVEPRAMPMVMPAPDEAVTIPIPPPSAALPVERAPAPIPVPAPAAPTAEPVAAAAPAAVVEPAVTEPPAEKPLITAAIPPALAPAPEIVPPKVAPDSASTQANTSAPMSGRLPPYRAAALESATEPVTNTIEAPVTVMVHLPRPKPPLSPAQRLDLHGHEYDRAEKCLAQAIYFEARNEPVRGQQAVAQVVLNRVFSPYYPKDVCSVVYQNAHRHLSCQFTFACDGKPEAIRERGAWARAQRIARQTLDAQIWLPDVNKATHYHAAYVRPNWIRDMKVMVRHGLHTFYRPRNWGDGSNEAQWASASNTAQPESAAKQAATAAAHKKVPLRNVYARRTGA
jgi:spore germination cell wall hydrolase CwlJ-like protein